MIAAISKVLGSFLFQIYSVVGNYAFAIIIFTVVVKLLLLPLTFKQLKSQKDMQAVQPKIQELQKKYKNDKETLNVKTMELYKEHKINPMAGCLPLLVQMPILFGLFRALREPVEYVFASAGEQAAVLAANATDVAFLWMPNLVEPDLITNIMPSATGFMATLPGLLPLLAAVLTYVQSKQMNTSTGANAKKDSSANTTMQTMTIMMPMMILMFGRQMSAGLMVYWTMSTVFQLAQQTALGRVKKEVVK